MVEGFLGEWEKKDRFFCRVMSFVYMLFVRWFMGMIRMILNWER